MFQRLPYPHRLAVMAVCAAGILCVAGCAPSDEAPDVPEGALYCYVGGTMRPVMADLARRYEAETGRTVHLDYAGSGVNKIKVEQTRRGDLYVAHDPFHGAMVREDLATEGWLVACITPYIAVPKGNPKGIGGLMDLTKPGVRVALTHPQKSTTGHIYRVMFEKAGITDAIAENVVVRTRGGGEAANQVVLGGADAAIVWNAVIHLRRDELDRVDIEPQYRPHPDVDAVTTATYGRIDMSRIGVTIDLLSFTDRPEAARAFAEYCASEENQSVWKAHGFELPAGGPKHLPGETAPDGDAEASGAGPEDARPDAGKSLYLYCGAGLRPAMKDVIAAFTARTGAAVEADYGGSGVIISRMRASGRGDLFMPGDVWYVELAEKGGLVASKAMVCYFVPVILVQEGNPKAIEGVADLARPGLKLGLGNPKACQIGRISRQIFAKNGIDLAAVQANLAFSSTTVNELGIQVRTGHLDAVIVWDAIAAFYADAGEVVEVPPQQNVISRVAIAVLESAADPALAERFVTFTTSDEGQALFRRHHYRTEPPGA